MVVETLVCSGLAAVGCVAALVYVAVPSLIKLNPAIVKFLIFLEKARWPLFCDYTKPEKYGLQGTCNFYLKPADDIKVGVWHIPASGCLDGQEDTDGRTPVFLYLHGNAASRAQGHRVELYKILAKENIHVFALDYRGYADSSGKPTEDGCVEDSMVLYDWMKAKYPNAPIYIWGHSLGTGITVKVTKLLSEKSCAPNAIVLEAPFNNIKDAAISHLLAAPYRCFAFYRELLLNCIDLLEVKFASDESISHVNCPILFLHAKDDREVPYSLGRKLYAAANESGRRAKFITFPAEKKFGHNDIYKAENIGDIIRNFISETVD